MDEYKNCNLNIVRICERICDTSLIKLKVNHAYELNELVEEMSIHRHREVDQLLEYCKQITEYIIVVFEGFENNIPSVNNPNITLYLILSL